MKRIRIGTAAGGCTWERVEPAVELVEKGGIDYLVFECLSERTVAELQAARTKNPEKGYNPQLEERMYRLLRLCREKNVRIVSNMGGANTPAAVRAIVRIARELGLTGIRIAMVEGDDITDKMPKYYDTPLWDREGTLGQLKDGIRAANVYLGAEPIREALDNGADLVITGRVADAALFMGPVMHEFGWTPEDRGPFGQAILMGHLMECGTQVTGGYYADPGYKDVPGMHCLGMPIAEMDETGAFTIGKPEGSGGLVTVDVCKEQLLYEIADPARYITPDAVADFSHVSFRQAGPDLVECAGATCGPRTDTYKVNIGYEEGWLAEASISFGGSTAIERARLAEETVRKRLEIIGVRPEEYRADFIGLNSLYKDAISGMLTPQAPSEIRLRVAARTATEDEGRRFCREVQCFYINGPAGSCGIRASVTRMLSVENILVPREDVPVSITYVEV